MGLFNRKSSKVSIDGGESVTSSSNRSSAALKSPLPLRTPSNSHFNSPSLPDVALPKPPDPKLDPAAYLRSIHAVRDRSKVIFNKAMRDKLEHFDVDMASFQKTAEYAVSIIKVGANASTPNAPIHGT